MDIFDTIYQKIFEGKIPTLFLGSGCSIATGISLGMKVNFPSMFQLAKVYYNEIAQDLSWNSSEIRFWDRFKRDFECYCKGGKQFNLEKFLLANPLPEDSILLDEILECTVSSFHDPHEELNTILNSDHKIEYPLRQLLEKLLKSLPRNKPYLEIISPNYDLIVEYTADLLGVPCLNGFSGNIIRLWKPEIGLIPPLLVRNGSREHINAKHIKYIKPHGSYSWFSQDNDVVEYLGGQSIGQGWSRCMIVPGPTKYQNSLKDVRREHMKYMDASFRRSHSIMIIGYGLNDSHLEEGLKDCIKKEVPVLIVTKDLSQPSIDEYILGNKNVFAVVNDTKGSKVLNDNKVFKFDEEYWKLSCLNKKLIN